MTVLKQFSLEGKVAIVAGGAGLLGRKICEGLLDVGADIAIVDMQLDQISKWLTKVDGERLQAFQCDISNKTSVVDCVQAIIEMFGKIDILFNNAAT